MIDRIETDESVEHLEARLIHGNPERYRRAIIAIFSGQIVCMFIAWLIFGTPSLEQTIPVHFLRMLTVLVLIVTIVCMVIVLFKRNIHLATSIMSICYSLFFIPTLLLTGGFLSPFVPVYLLIMMLSVVLVDVNPPVIGKISSAIIMSSYLGVSLAQKYGFQPVVISYVQPLLELDYFFWLIVLITSSSLLQGYLTVNASSRNVRETLTQLILTYRYVAKGTSLFVSDNFISELLQSFKKALNVKSTFLLEWSEFSIDQQDQNCSGKLILVSENGTTEKTIPVATVLRNEINKKVYEYNHELVAICPYLDSCLALDFTPKFGYWTPIFDVDGKIIGILGAADPVSRYSQDVLISDIVQIFSSRTGAEFARRHEEQKRLHMQALLAQGQKMQAIGHLSSSIAHDFNNILNGVFGFASLISRSSDPQSQMRKYAEKIIQLGKNAGGLISQLLVYSRPTMVSSNKVQLNQVVNECTEIVKYTNKKRITVSRELFEQEISIDGDTSMIQSAILNLLINACDATEHDGQVIVKSGICQINDGALQEVVSGKKIPEGWYAYVITEDTGCGIPGDKLMRIFEPFYTTKGIGHGTGLGLSAVFGCMEAHKGYIMVDSTPGKGSVFQLFFPIAGPVVYSSIRVINTESDMFEQCLPVTDSDSRLGATDTTKIQDATVPGGRETSALSPQTQNCDVDSRGAFSGSSKESCGTILLIDDECAILESLTEYLSGTGYKVIGCNCGLDALACFKQHEESIDVVILDMILPDIKGTDVYDRLRQLNPVVNVVIITGYSTADDIEYVKNRGVQVIHYKPFDFKDLEKSLAMIISGGV